MASLSSFRRKPFRELTDSNNNISLTSQQHQEFLRKLKLVELENATLSNIVLAEKKNLSTVLQKIQSRSKSDPKIPQKLSESTTIKKEKRNDENLSNRLQERQQSELINSNAIINRLERSFSDSVFESARLISERLDHLTNCLNIDDQTKSKSNEIIDLLTSLKTDFGAHSEISEFISKNIVFLRTFADGDNSFSIQNLILSREEKHQILAWASERNIVCNDIHSFLSQLEMFAKFSSASVTSKRDLDPPIHSKLWTSADQIEDDPLQIETGDSQPAKLSLPISFQPDEHLHIIELENQLTARLEELQSIQQYSHEWLKREALLQEQLNSAHNLLLRKESECGILQQKLALLVGLDSPNRPLSPASKEPSIDDDGSGTSLNEEFLQDFIDLKSFLTIELKRVAKTSVSGAIEYRKHLDVLASLQAAVNEYKSDRDSELNRLLTSINDADQRNNDLQDALDRAIIDQRSDKVEFSRKYTAVESSIAEKDAIIEGLSSSSQTLQALQATLEIQNFELRAVVEDEKRKNKLYESRLVELQEFMDLLDRKIIDKGSESPRTPAAIRQTIVAYSSPTILTPIDTTDPDEVNLLSQFECVMEKMKGYADALDEKVLSDSDSDSDCGSGDHGSALVDDHVLTLKDRMFSPSALDLSPNDFLSKYSSRELIAQQQSPTESDKSGSTNIFLPISSQLQARLTEIRSQDDSGQATHHILQLTARLDSLSSELELKNLALQNIETDNFATLSRLKSLEKSCEEYAQELYRLNMTKNREVDENQGLRAQIAILEGRLDLKNQTLETTSAKLAVLENLYADEVTRLSLSRSHDADENRRLRIQIIELESLLQNDKS